VRQWTQQAVNHRHGKLGHGLPGIERAQAIGDELPLEIAITIAEGGAGCDQDRGGVAVRPAS
jgi:hypothetical protein